MSDRTKRFKPKFDAITKGTKEEEEEGLNNIATERKRGASQATLNTRIDDLCNAVKKKTDQQVDDLHESLKEASAASESELEVFKRWFQEEAAPMAADVIRLMDVIFGLLKDAALNILKALFKAVSQAIVKFVSERKDCWSKTMASRAHWTPNTSATETIVRRAEEQVPHPTLRLKRNFEKECEEAKIRLLDQIRQGLHQKIEELRTLLKSNVPSDPKEIEKYENALPALEALVEEQSNFNGQLLEAVGVYLLEAWKKMQGGADSKEMKGFREKKRKELCKDFDQRTSDLKMKILKKLDGL